MRGRNKTHDTFFLGQPFVKNYLYMNRTYFGTRVIQREIEREIVVSWEEIVKQSRMESYSHNSYLEQI